MNILFAANTATLFSGGQISLLELLSSLDRKRFRPLVLCPGSGILSQRIKEMGIPLIIWEMPTARTFHIRRIQRKAQELRGIIKKYQPDIVHTDGSRIQLYASLGIRGTRAKLLWHVRESVRDLPLYDGFLALASNKILCVSHSVKKKRFGWCPWVYPKIEVIYNGVDLKKFFRDKREGASFRKKWSIPPKEYLLGNIGLLAPVKGHPTLLRALRILSKNFPHVRLLIMGKTVDLRYYDRLRGMAGDWRIDKNLMFKGPEENIKGVLSGIDIFILTSQREGFSRALLEAMACSLPIVASNVSGNKEAIINGKTGLLVPYGNARLTAEAIAYLIKHPEEARRMGREARKYAKEKFSIENHVLKIQELYGKMSL
ncbi:MAG: glycosyltransferase family 4 protein [Candidatus Aminicenantes bacterium]|nr:glycosyltransferase family 4 protein [Candidatus Aminicenantes bacterium]